MTRSHGLPSLGTGVRYIVLPPFSSQPFDSFFCSLLSVTSWHTRQHIGNIRGVEFKSFYIVICIYCAVAAVQIRAASDQCNPLTSITFGDCQPQRSTRHLSTFKLRIPHRRRSPCLHTGPAGRDQPCVGESSHTTHYNLQKRKRDTIRTYMSALVFAAANLLLFLYGAHAQWVDRPVLSLVSTSTADFSIATASPNDPVANMDGAVFDAFPSSSPNPTQSLAAALATGAAKSTAAAIAAAGSSIQSDDDDQGECRLLGPFALLVQLALGGLALMSLVYKRWRERPQRPLKIWFFDASKQVFGSVLVHVANVFMSMLTSGRFSIKVEPAAVGAVARSLVTRVAAGEGNEYTPNPCSFYLLNLAIDVSLISSVRFQKDGRNSY